MKVRFDDASTYVRIERDERDFAEFTAHRLQSVYSKIAHHTALCCAPPYIPPVDDSYLPLDAEVVWKEESAALVLLVPGLFALPYYSYPDLETFRRVLPDCDIVAPFIPEDGDCSLEAAALRPEELVRSYLEFHRDPNKPVCLIGESNGARIIGHVEHRVRDVASRVHVFAAGGPFFGTEWMNRYDSLCRCSSLYSDSVVEELQYGSDAAIGLITRMQEPLLPGIIRKFVFVSSRDDLLVSPHASSHPEIAGAEHIILEGVNHWDIVHETAGLAAEKAREFLEGEG